MQKGKQISLWVLKCEDLLFSLSHTSLFFGIHWLDIMSKILIGVGALKTAEALKALFSLHWGWHYTACLFNIIDPL